VVLALVQQVRLVQQLVLVHLVQQVVLVHLVQQVRLAMVQQVRLAGTANRLKLPITCLHAF
jgi:hypothetical protein